MKIENRDVFEQIGNLFYAIAADQQLKPLEAGELKFLISKDWLPRNLEKNKSIISDETHFIVMAMDARLANKVSAREAFAEFARFYSLHSEIFTQEIKQRILDTSLEIIDIFKADNPSDNQSLVALTALFNNVCVDA